MISVISLAPWFFNVIYALPHSHSVEGKNHVCDEQLQRMFAPSVLRHMRKTTALERTFCTGMKTLTIHVMHGLGNRLRAYASARVCAEASNRSLLVIWQPDLHCGATFDELMMADAVPGAASNEFVQGMFRADDFKIHDLMVGNHENVLIDDKVDEHIYIRSAYEFTCKSEPPQTYQQFRTQRKLALQNLQPALAISHRIANYTYFFADYHVIGVHLRMDSDIKHDVPQISALEGTDPKGIAAMGDFLSHRQACHWQKMLPFLRELIQKRNQSGVQKGRLMIFVTGDDKLGRLGLETTLSSEFPFLRVMPSSSMSDVEECLVAANQRGSKCMLFAWYELLLLAGADEIVGSEWSSFSDTACLMQAPWGLCHLGCGVDKKSPSQSLMVKVPTTSSEPLVSAVIACMNRKNYFIKSFRALLAQRRPRVRQIVVVDWNSDTLLSNFMEDAYHPGLIVTYIRVLWTDGFSLARAYNLGLQHTLFNNVLKVDCETVVSTGLIRRYRRDCTTHRVAYRGDWMAATIENELHNNGVIWACRRDLMGVGGYDERFDAYGYEDSNLHERLEHDGVALRSFGHEDVHHLRHGHGVASSRSIESMQIVSGTFEPWSALSARSTYRQRSKSVRMSPESGWFISYTLVPTWEPTGFKKVAKDILGDRKHITYLQKAFQLSEPLQAYYEQIASKNPIMNCTYVSCNENGMMLALTRGLPSFFKDLLTACLPLLLLHESYTHLLPQCVRFKECGSRLVAKQSCSPPTRAQNRTSIWFSYRHHWPLTGVGRFVDLTMQQIEEIDFTLKQGTSDSQQDTIITYVYPSDTLVCAVANSLSPLLTDGKLEKHEVETRVRLNTSEVDRLAREAVSQHALVQEDLRSLGSQNVSWVRMYVLEDVFQLGANEFLCDLLEGWRRADLCSRLRKLRPVPARLLTHDTYVRIVNMISNWSELCKAVAKLTTQDFDSCSGFPGPLPFGR